MEKKAEQGMKITFTKQAIKDLKKIEQNKSLKRAAFELLSILEKNPYEPPYEKLSGKLKGYYSRRINIQHRLVYLVLEDEIKVVSIWTHYEF